MLNSKKTYYSIREVCDRTGLEPHVLKRLIYDEQYTIPVANKKITTNMYMQELNKK